MKCRNFELTGGQLEVNVHDFDRSFDELCVIGSRYNQKRPFIFISKVLGKHWPVKPSTMCSIHKQLAQKLNKIIDIGDDPVLFIAMAETAIGLGRGVFDEFFELNPTMSLFFIHTTRYSLRTKIALDIDEPHSHARRHLVYFPQSSEGVRQFSNATTLVLVDDEISTGRTLNNLALAYIKQFKSVKHVIFISITNWLADNAYTELRKDMPVKVDMVNLLKGTFDFILNANAMTMPNFKSESTWAPVDTILKKNFGRLGITPAESRLSLNNLKQIAKNFNIPKETDIRVVGTGEFIYEPYLLAKCFEEIGHNVIFQSSTRTPIVAENEIKNAINFVDNYNENIDNFLYNIDDNFDGETIIVYETWPLPNNHNLPSLLNARLVIP
jgi:hypothetical protein